MRFAFYLIFFVALSANAQKCALDAVEPMRVSDEVDQFSTKNDEKTVKFHGVDRGDGRGAPGYGGPIEVLASSGATLCKVDHELMRPPFMFAKTRYFYFLQADAIDARVQVLDLDNCQIVWQSRKYAWAKPAKISTSAWYLAGKTVPFKADCLPAAPSAPFDRADP